jgi:hypothetical protein
MISIVTHLTCLFSSQNVNYKLRMSKVNKIATRIEKYVIRKVRHSENNRLITAFTQTVMRL